MIHLYHISLTKYYTI